MQNILILLNKPGMQSLVIFSLFFINIILNYLLIPTFGINGASVATAITNIVSALILKRVIYNEFKIKV